MNLPTTCRACGARVRAAKHAETGEPLALELEPDLFIPGVDNPDDAFRAVEGSKPSTVEIVRPLNAAVEVQVYKRHNCRG